MERIPILEMGPVLLVSIQVDMHDQLALTLQDDLTDRIVRTRARSVLIDISSLEVVDSFIGRMLGNIAAVSRVLDADTVVVGMRPAVAITLVELGMSLSGVRTALTVEHALEMLRAATANGDAGATGAGRPRRGMIVARTEKLPVQTTEDIVRVRQAVRAWAVELGFNLVDQTKLVTAASELARNTVTHGGGGTVELESLVDGARRALSLTFADQGPGIADVEQALRDGFTTGGGLGLGLGGARRLCNEFELRSTSRSRAGRPPRCWRSSCGTPAPGSPSCRGSWTATTARPPAWGSGSSAPGG